MRHAVGTVDPVAFGERDLALRIRQAHLGVRPESIEDCGRASHAGELGVALGVKDAVERRRSEGRVERCHLLGRGIGLDGGSEVLLRGAGEDA